MGGGSGLKHRHIRHASHSSLENLEQETQVYNMYALYQWETPIFMHFSESSTFLYVLDFHAELLYENVVQN